MTDPKKPDAHMRDARPGEKDHFNCGGSDEWYDQYPTRTTTPTTIAIWTEESGYPDYISEGPS